MTQPAVIITEQDGALGILPASAGRLLAVIGPTHSGPANTPATFAKVKDLVTTFGGGAAVEAASYFIDAYSKPVLFVRANATVAGAVGPITSVPGAGTSIVTVQAGAIPNDDHELAMKVVAGGTIATAGITYQLSYDGGRSYGPTTALGTANTVAFPDAGTVVFALGVGTLAAGATYSARASGPNYGPADINLALDALAASIANWELALFAGPLEPAVFDNIELKFNGMFTAGKFHGWIGNTRMPNAAESEAAYLTALSTAWASKATKRGSLYAGACKLSSAVSGRKYRRPVAFAAGAREGSVSEEINIADPNLGSLVGCAIRDANGNPDEHDETLNPGLDDARFGVLRTWNGMSGVYVNRPRILSSEISDFQLMPHRRVLDLTHAALTSYFVRRLNKPIRLNKTSGYILESEALEIEAGARAVMRAVLLAKPKASAILFQLSRTDNLLSTKTLTGTARVLPLAYPEFIQLDVGFINPALLVQAA